jgi:hypothetical protein
MTSEEVLLEKFKGLPADKKQEVLDFTEFLQSRLQKKAPRRSLKGALADLQINLTEDDMREARNEMWRGYTKDTENEK